MAGYVTIRSKIRANIFTRIFEQKTYSSSVLFVVSGKLPGMPYIILEYASGGSLRNHMKYKTLQPLREEEIQNLTLL